MEKRESRKNQHPFPCRLLPLQNLKPEIKFCSLAELKTCLDSAQINSFQKESKDSILKLLEGDIRSSEVEKRCFSLWKNSRNESHSVPWETKELKNKDKATKLEKKTVQPHKSKDNFNDPTQKVPKSISKQISKTSARQPVVAPAQAKSKESVCNKSTLSDQSGLSEDTEISTTTSTTVVDDETLDYSESVLLSDLGDYQTSSEVDYNDDHNDEFDELSDIDGDDSAIVSQCNSSLSWTSLDAKQEEVSESVTTTDSGLGSDADISTHLPVTQSLFKHCPLVLYFPSEHEKISKLPRALQKQLKWKMSTITPNVVKNVIARSGFVASTKRREWIGYWGKHMKASAFRNIQSHQKVNHFPGTFEIGRKDKLWKNLNKAQIKYSKKEYDFVPLTFCLPSEWKTFKRYWDETGHKQKWIIKPPASARGIGIKVIHKINQIPRKRSIIIQRYLANPYLINGRKFDLRLYVYVSSYDPLCIYIYDNGLVRFASSKYSHSNKSLSNRYVHLTNYSVNKYNDAYIKNEDESGTESHKWGLKALWKYLQMAGQDVDSIKSKITNIVIKTIIASVPTVTSLSKSHCKYRHTCHELFGFDIFLDYHLKPWLIEVNISPSLHTSAPLDKHIKYGLVRDLFNTAGFLVPQYPNRAKSTVPSSRGPQSSGTGTPKGSVITTKTDGGFGSDHVENVTDIQLYFNPGIQLSSDEKAKHAYFTQKFAMDSSVAEKILDTLTPDDIRVLMNFEDEVSRKGNLELVFPTENSAKFLKYFALPKFYDLLVLQWVKKYARDPHRGVVRLQKLAESQVQFSRQPTSPDNIWCKHNTRTLQRYDKIRDKKRSSPINKIKDSSSLKGSTHQLTASLDVFLKPKKGVSPITYKPPLPLPATRPSVQTVILARSQPGLAQLSRPGAVGSSRSHTTGRSPAPLQSVRQRRQSGHDKISDVKLGR